MMSILPPSNAFLVLTRFATFLLQVLTIIIQLDRVDNAGAAWLSCLLKIEWNDQGCLEVAGGRNDCGRKPPALPATCVRLLPQLYAWLQQQDDLWYITMQILIGFRFFLLFCFILLFDCVMEMQSTTMHMPPLAET